MFRKNGKESASQAANEKPSEKPTRKMSLAFFKKKPRTSPSLQAVAGKKTSEESGSAPAEVVAGGDAKSSTHHIEAISEEAPQPVEIPVPESPKEENSENKLKEDLPPVEESAAPEVPAEVESGQVEKDVKDGSTEESAKIEKLVDEPKPTEDLDSKLKTASEPAPVAAAELGVEDEPSKEAENVSAGGTIEATDSQFEGATDAPNPEVAQPSEVKVDDSLAVNTPKSVDAPKSEAVDATSPPVVSTSVEKVAELPPKEKVSRRSSIFGRFGTLKSKKSNRKSMLPPTKETPASAPAPMKEIVNGQRSRAQKPAKLSQTQNKARMEPTSPRVLASPYSAHFSTTSEKETKEPEKKQEITGSGFGQDVYF